MQNINFFNHFKNIVCVNQSFALVNIPYIDKFISTPPPPPPLKSSNLFLSKFLKLLSFWERAKCNLNSPFIPFSLGYWLTSAKRYQTRVSRLYAHGHFPACEAADGRPAKRGLIPLSYSSYKYSAGIAPLPPLEIKNDLPIPPAKREEWGMGGGQTQAVSLPLNLTIQTKVKPCKLQTSCEATGELN